MKLPPWRQATPAVHRHPAPAIRRWRWSAAAAVALVVGLAGLAEWAWWPFLRAPLERTAARVLQRDVSLGAGFGVRLLGHMELRTDALVVGPPRSGSTATGFLQAQGVQATLPYAGLLAQALARARGDTAPPLHVQSLRMRQLALQLERDAHGVANWQFGQFGQFGHAGPPVPPRGAGDTAATRSPRIDTLVVEAGTIRLDDALRQVVLDLKVSQTAAGKRAGDAQPAAADATVAAGGLLVRGAGTYRGTPLRARIDAAGLLPLMAAGSQGTPVPFRLDLVLGRIELDLEGQVRGLWRLHGLDGRFRLAGPSLAAVGDALDLTLPSTDAFVARGQITKDGTEWRARVEHFAVGSSRLNGDFRFAAATSPGGPPGRLSGTLGGARLALRDLGPAFGAPPRRDAAGPRERVLPQRDFNLPSLGRMQAEVAVRLDTLDLGTPQLAPFTPLQGTVVLHDKVLSIRELLAQNAGGELQGTVTLDARTELPQWQGDLRWSGVQLERWVQARNPLAQAAPSGRQRAAAQHRAVAAAAGAASTRRASPVAPRAGRDPPARETAAGAFIGGRLSGQARLQGRGRSTAAMLASLDGSVSLWVRGGHISHLVVELMGIDLAESLGLLIRGDDPLPLRCALAQVEARDGRLRVTTGVLDTPDTTLLIGGELSLAQEQLALQVQARPRDFSPLALRAPLRIEGSFAQPQVQLDVPGMGARVAAAVGLAAAVPLAGLLALVDLGEPDRAACEQAWQRLQKSRTAPGAPARPPGPPAPREAAPSARVPSPPSP